MCSGKAQNFCSSVMHVESHACVEDAAVRGSCRIRALAEHPISFDGIFALAVANA